MTPFLEEVAKDIIEKYSDISQICIVFPNKRAGIFFRRYYGKLSGHSTWSPTIYTIDKLVQYATGLKTADRLGLLFDFYSIFVNVKGDKLEDDYTFDKFYHLGETILNDFNELDSYLIDVKLLFANIKETEEYNNLDELLDEEQQEVLNRFWKHFSVENLSTEKEKFMALWEILPLLHQQFTDYLLERKYAYNGLIYRELDKLIQNKELRLPDYKKIIFVGFNALNKAEENFFEYLHLNDKALFYWDSDAYYQFDNRQEAGMFARKNAELLSKGENWPPQSNLNNAEKKLSLIGAPLEVAQSKLIPLLLSKCNDIDTLNNDTAIVLADEHLLFPVLHSLPPEVEKINVTMGYPFKETSIYGLINSYLNAQASLRINNNSVEFFYKDVISILRHSVIQEYNQEMVTATIEGIEAKSMVYIKAESLTSSKNNIYQLLFTRIATGNALFVNTLNLLYELFSKGKETNTEVENSVEDEYIYHIYLTVKRLKEILDSRNVEISVHIGIKILLQMLGKLSIPFSGEPLEGIQVMGMLETRNLDFKNLIILGVNEGICPSAANSTSLISEQIRTAFKLPNRKHADAMYAYYFYRIIQRAENITMVYNNITGYNNLKEVSRFVKQLKYESNLKFVESDFIQDLHPTKNKEIIVEKNEDILKKLRRFVKDKNKQTKVTNSYYSSNFHPLSSSAVNTWIDCKLKFYFRYVVRIPQPPSHTVEVDPIMFGNLLHKAIEILYSNHIANTQNKTIEQSDIDVIIKKIPQSIDSAFTEYYETEENSKFEYKGNQLIIREVLKKHITNILLHDKTTAPFTIISLESEKNYPAQIPITVNDKTIEIALDGTLDRIDEKDGLIRIMDYKTGATQKDFNSIEELFDSNKADRKSAVLQAFFYGILYRSNNPKNTPLWPSILKVRDLQSRGFNTNIYYQKTILQGDLFDELLDEFEVALSEKLAEIYHPDISFSQTENSRKCMYCPYNIICGK